MDSTNDIYKALIVVRRDAERNMKEHQEALLVGPLFGWDTERHETYHNRHIVEAKTVITYCIVRCMQINPD
jgi:hypothetical protein